jgi:lipopolysaccharide heptosyltransferase II
MSLNIDQIKNVLVLAPDKHMGDLVLSLSAINALKEHFKEKRFYLVIDSGYTEIVETIKGLENVILYPRRLLNRNPFIKRIAILLNFLRQLRNMSPDIAIDLQGGVASSTMTFLTGAPLRIGRSTAKRPYLYNVKVDIKHGRHKFYTFTDIAYAAGVKGIIDAYSLSSSVEKRGVLKNILMNEKISLEKPVICIHPGAGVMYKQWTDEGFAEVSDWIVSKGYQAVFVGTRKESAKIEHITSIMKNHAYNLAGKLSLGELIALIEIASLYLGNDSGPMHLAASVGTPVVALFGPASENRWDPFSKEAIVLRGAQRCEKCTGKECEYDFKCIRMISADDVKAAAEKLVQSKQKPVMEL